VSDEAPRRAPMLSLRELVDHYASLVPGFGHPLALSAFGLTVQETQIIFTHFDEDYHISRFLRFSNGEGNSYLVGGAPATHVSIDPAIRSIL